jgi:uncharacterized membrane protein SpoIIM required for sporulation
MKKPIVQKSPEGKASAGIRLWHKLKEHILQNRFIKISLILLFAGFFLGYSMRYLDFIKRPILENVGVIYPIQEQYIQNYYPFLSSDGGISIEKSSDAYTSYAIRPGYEEIGQSPIDLLYVMRNNIISALILIATGVLIGIPSVIYLFVVGLAAGASIPEVLEFASFGIASKVIFCLIFYAIAVIIATSIGIELGRMVLDFIRGREVRIEKNIYDRAILVIAFVIVNIALQFVLLVM